jgi:hypothetical protein
VDDDKGGVCNHRCEKEHHNRDEFEPLRKNISINDPVSQEADAYINDNQQARFPRPHCKEKAKRTDEETAPQYRFECPVLSVSSAAVGTLDQKSIPVIPARDDDIASAMKTRPQFSFRSALRLSCCGKVVEVQRWGPRCDGDRRAGRIPCCQRIRLRIPEWQVLERTARRRSAPLLD